MKHLGFKNFSAKVAMTACASLALLSSAEAVVLVDFEESASGVRVSFDGQLALNEQFIFNIDTVTDPGEIAADTSYLVTNGNFNIGSLLGVAVNTSLNTFTVSSNSGRSFGFSQGALIWDDASVNLGAPANPTLLEVTASDYFFDIDGETLASIGADQLSTNDSLWTAISTSDEFRVGSVTIVPEPTSAALLAFAGMGCLMRRRRS